MHDGYYSRDGSEIAKQKLEDLGTVIRHFDIKP